ncbi:hypothetical protein D3C73_577470 [compost metagenome]
MVLLVRVAVAVQVKVVKQAVDRGARAEAQGKVELVLRVVRQVPEVRLAKPDEVAQAVS